MKTFSLEFPTVKPDYVGLRINNGKVHFIFPCNYPQVNDKEIKKDMINLLKLIDKYKSLDYINDNNLSINNFPFESYLWIIRDFLENGYYKVIEENYIKGKTGKVNWKKTIKNNDIYLDNEDIIFKDFIVKTNSINLNDIITIIHQYIVYVSVFAMGWYYDIDEANIFKPNIKYSKDYMLSILKKEYGTSFTDSKKILLRNMINVLEGLDEVKFNSKSFDISTNEFEYVFERLVEERFGNQNSKRFNPYCEYCIDNKIFNVGNLRPDTILINSNNAFIIDAKYYRYGYTNDINQLPDVSSIHKQITYAEDFEVRYKEMYDVKGIYNLFILPCSSDKLISYVGYGSSSWKNDDKTYNKVYVLLVDLRSLVNNELNNKSMWIKYLICELNVNSKTLGLEF